MKKILFAVWGLSLPSIIMVFFFVWNVSAGKLEDDLRMAIILDHTDEVKMLLDKGANIEVKDQYLGRTPLMEAAYHGKADIVRLLLDRGADVKASNDGGWTALMLSSSAGSAEVVRLLLDKGANVNTKSINGTSPLGAAAYEGRLEVVRVLLDKGANIEAKDGYGMTPLMKAASGGKADVVGALLDKGARIEAMTDCCGWTALMYAADKGDLGVVQIFVDKGANIDAKNLRDETASTIAVEKGHPDVLRVLARKSDPSQMLKQRIADLRNNRYDDNRRKEIIMLVQEMKSSPEISETAKQNFMKAAAYMKAAKEASDFKLAIDAYDAALLDAPWWGNAYYNLSIALKSAGDHYRAKGALNLYLLTKPSEADKNLAQQQIFEIEAQQELQKKREAAVRAKYGNRQGGGYGVDDLYRYGAVVQNMSFDASGNERVISLKIVTRKESGFLRTYFQITDLTSRNDVYLQTFSADWRGTNTFYLDDRTYPNKQLMTMTVTSYGDGDANITIRPANNASAGIKTTLNALLKELASQAVYAGDRMDIGGREFYVLAQGGAKGSLIFFPPEIKNMLESGSVRDMMPKLVANVNYRASDGTNARYMNSDLGDVNGTRYHLEFDGSYYVAKPGRGEDH